jgi:hypothetical protein
VKRYHLTHGLLAGLLLASPIAGAEEKYPAADFQPEVIYQDAEYIGKQQAQPVAKPESAAPSTDSKYPAANFQPEVLYQDAEQIEKLGRPAASPTKPAPPAAISRPAPGREPSLATSSGTETQKESGGGLLENYWVGLVVLAVAGFAIYSRRSKPEVGEAPTYTVDASGLTGVARYIQMKTMSEPTGVQKYIEKHQKEFTGVERYLREHG